MRQLRLAVLLTFVAAILAAPSFCAPVKYRTSGNYVDSAGGQHAWSINDAHTLVWENAPYLPVGAVFVSRYISLAQTDENYQADVKALETAASKGVTDIVVRPTGPITSTDPAAWQKIIDYLDAKKLTYGIELDDGPAEPLKGYLISPNRYRLEGPLPEATITRSWPDVDAAIYVVVRKSDNSIAATGGAFVKDGKVEVRLADPLAAGEVLVIYPRKAAKNAGDIWTGFGEYRDRVLAFFGKLKLGPGMRFFLEPFTGKMDFVGEMAGFIPDSSGFRVGLEAYLTRRYGHEGGLNSAWGLNESLESIEVGARLVPLWNAGRGISYAYDRASARLYPVDPVVTQLWRDLTDFRDCSTNSRDKIDSPRQGSFSW